MTPAIVAAAAPLPAPLASPAAMTPQASNAYDVDRLRNLIANVQPGAQSATATPPVTETTQSGFNTIGDSILQGVAKFNSGYNDSLDAINTKLQHIANTDTLDLGNNFGELMQLQVEVARWSMSVMGVDNASKAGTNTIKELSKGG